MESAPATLPRHTVDVGTDHAASGQEGGFDPTATQTETPEGGTSSLTGATNASATGGGSDDETGTAETTTANRTTRSN